MVEYKQVSKEELTAFVQSFPHNLVRDVNGMCEPPQLTYNDFSDGKVWPESIVAKVILHSAMWAIPAFAGIPDAHYIREDLLPQE